MDLPLAIYLCSETGSVPLFEVWFAKECLEKLVCSVNSNRAKPVGLRESGYSEKD
jgi:hypothetical protein